VIGCVLCLHLAIYKTSSDVSPALSALPLCIVMDKMEASNKVDEYGSIVQMFGKPDTEDSTAYDNPQPP